MRAEAQCVSAAEPELEVSLLRPAYGRPPLRQLILFGAAGLAVLAVLTWAAGEVAVERTRSGLERRAGAAAALHVALLRSELEKHRSLPFVLAEDPDARTTLEFGGADRIRDMNLKLEKLGEQTRAAVIYLLDTRGVAVAASNWRLTTSFVGSNYSFRPYFREAMLGETPEHFALGAVSKAPGLFLARRVVSRGKIVGVVVVKVDFTPLEDEWSGSGDPAFVAESHGIVLVTSVPEWRFRPLRPLEPHERARLKASLQFGDAPLTPLPFTEVGRNQVEVRTDSGRTLYVSASTPGLVPGWTLRLFTPASTALATAATGARLVAFLLGAAVLLGMGMLWLSRKQAVAKAFAQQRARALLESRVAERTKALQVANDRLVLEMEERRRAETSRQIMQDELVQANKLAALGQIAAGVAHEINQPVAAIRSYADNAVVLLDRQENGPARSNLAIIASLTEKIGLITDELRAFSRKTSGRPQPLAVEGAIAGALLLIGARARQQGVRIVREGSAAGVNVLAERVRLEQVLVNLLQNALEALTDTPQAEVRIGVQTAGREVRITVADNGPGLDVDMAAGLFTPFLTTKANGLGLGLVISHDLVAEFGGELTLESRPGDGAVFVITLKMA